MDEPQWLKDAIERARDEGRILNETAPVALPAPSAELHKKKPAQRQVRVRASVREAEFQLQVIEYAQARGWRVAHFRAVRVQRRDGTTFWETPVAADGRGFFDLLLVRARLVAIELKVPPNTLTEDQLRWLEWYKKAGVEAHVFRPADWPAIEEVLR